eukprot:gene921-228_t
MKRVFYNVYAHLDQDSGEILYAKCNCKAGQGGCCKHVAALLYTLLDYTSMELKKIPDTMTCTQIAQKWHVPSAANMTLCKAMKFSEVALEKAEPNKTRKQPTVSGMREDFCTTPPFAYRMSSEALQTLVKDLRHIGKAELFCKALASNEFEPSTQFETSCRKKELAKTTISDSSLAQSSAGGQDVIENIFKNIGNAVFDAEDMPDVETGKKVQKLVGISVEDASVLCRNTVNQSEEASWYDERSKRLTSSNFGRIIKRKKNIEPSSITKMITNPGSKRNSVLPASLQWGITNEAVALKKYSEVAFHSEETLEIESCGLVVSTKLPVGCIEVKCPYAKRGILLSKAAVEDRSFYLQSTDDMLQLKRNHAYYYQCQGAMNILNLPWIDFIVYTEVDIHIERIQRDTSLWDNLMVPELTDFFVKYNLPKFM